MNRMLIALSFLVLASCGSSPKKDEMKPLVFESYKEAESHNWKSNTPNVEFKLNDKGELFVKRTKRVQLIELSQKGAWNLEGYNTIVIEAKANAEKVSLTMVDESGSELTTDLAVTKSSQALKVGLTDLMETVENFDFTKLAEFRITITANKKSKTLLALNGFWAEAQ